MCTLTILFQNTVTS